MPPLRNKTSCALLLAMAAAACGDDAEGSGNGHDGDRDGATGESATHTGAARRDAAAGDPAPADETAWTHLGYDARSTFFNPHATSITPYNAATLTQKWAFTVAGYPTGSAAVAGGVVYALATGGLYAIDLEDGSELWHREDLTGQSSVAYDDGFLYVHTMPAELYKIDASDGSNVWGPVKTYDHPLADGTSSPVIAGGKVLVGHSTTAEIFETDIDLARGGVFAADLETGEEVWRYYTVELPENGAMVWSTVSVDLEAGMVFATTGNNYSVGGGGSDAIHAIDLATGAGLWVTQVRAGDTWSLFGGDGEDTDFGANPIVADAGNRRLVAAGSKAASFWALDRKDGAIVWSRPQLSASYSATTGGVLNNGAFDGTRFYVASNDPVADETIVYALDPSDGADLWKTTLDKLVWGMPTVANDVLFVPAGEDLHVLDARSGDALLVINTGGTIAAGGAAIVGDKLIIKSGLSYPFGTVVNNDQIYCYGLP